MNIICDTREKVGRWFFDAKGCSIIEKKLHTGDYSVEGLEDKLCIERKREVSELAMNITMPSFIHCLERMAQYKYRFIILEFGTDDISKFPVGSSIPTNKWNLIRIKGPYLFRFISDIQTKYGIHVIYAGNKYYAELSALNIMKRVHEQQFK